MLRKINGFSHYAVDEFGNVWSRKNNKWGLRKGWIKLQPWLGSDGYPKVTLYQNGKRVKRRVHHLVLEEFIGQCPEGMEACHYDGNPQNNRLSNLRWDTSKNNHADRIRHGNHIRGERQPLHVLKTEQVLIIKKMLKSGVLSQQIIADTFGVSRSAILNIHNGSNWSWLN